MSFPGKAEKILKMSVFHEILNDNIDVQSRVLPVLAYPSPYPSWWRSSVLSSIVSGPDIELSTTSSSDGLNPGDPSARRRKTKCMTYISVCVINSTSLSQTAIWHRQTENIEFNVARSDYRPVALDQCPTGKITWISLFYEENRQCQSTAHQKRETEQ